MAEQNVALGSNLEALYAVEDSWGELASSFDVYKLRTTGFGINMTRDSFTSDELRSDRQTADHRQGMDQVSGDLPVELSYNSFDDLIASAMFNDWTEDSLPEITIGTTQKSLRISRNFPAVNQYHEFSGCVVNSWSVSVEPNAIITSTFSMTGKGMDTYSEDGGYEDGEYVDSDNTSDRKLTSGEDKSTDSPFDSFSGSLYIGDGENDPSDSANEIAVVTGIEFTLENALSPMQVIGAKQAVGLIEGRASVSGTLSAYFVDSDMINRFLRELETSLLFTLTDNNDQSYEFFLPRIKFSGSDVSLDGESAATLSMPFTALVASSGPVSNTLRITRLAG